jgi:D-tyrosyl-tRNA(Tyr) deacylase
MRAVIQRVTRAEVRIGTTLAGQIGRGLLVLAGIEKGDQPADVEYLAAKTANLRIFEDEEGRMNRSLLDTGGAVLAVSQFTLLGDARKGRRPGFDAAERPELARPLFEHYVACLRAAGLHCECGVFQAEMQVSLCNDGPVTILLDSRKLF